MLLPSILHKYLPIEEIADWKKAHQHQNVVWTNGCFDLLHFGHISYLSEAKAMGDILVVGLNSDTSIKRLKGDSRPIMDFRSRLHNLMALEMVDYVCVFDEDTPLSCIKALEPDVLVKGADYQISEIVGAKEVLDNGGRVETITFEDGYSTTQIIDKIKGIK